MCLTDCSSISLVSGTKVIAPNTFRDEIGDLHGCGLFFKTLVIEYRGCALACPVNDLNLLCSGKQIEKMEKLLREPTGGSLGKEFYQKLARSFK